MGFLLETACALSPQPPSRCRASSCPIGREKRGSGRGAQGSSWPRVWVPEALAVCPPGGCLQSDRVRWNCSHVGHGLRRAGETMSGVTVRLGPAGLARRPPRCPANRKLGPPRARVPGTRNSLHYWSYTAVCFLLSQNILCSGCRSDYFSNGSECGVFQGGCLASSKTTSARSWHPHRAGPTGRLDSGLAGPPVPPTNASRET